MKDQESYLQERGFISSFQPSQTIGTLGGGTLGGGVDHKPLLPANRYFYLLLYVYSHSLTVSRDSFIMRGEGLR